MPPSISYTARIMWLARHVVVGVKQRRNLDSDISARNKRILLHGERKGRLAVGHQAGLKRGGTLFGGEQHGLQTIISSKQPLRRLGPLGHELSPPYRYRV